MNKRVVAAFIAVIICMLLCSCGKSHNAEKKPVQELKTLDIQSEDAADSLDDESGDKDGMPAKEDAAEVIAGEEQGEKDDVDPERDSQNEIINTPGDIEAEESVPTSDTTEDSQVAPSDNSTSDTFYDEYELPLDDT